MVANLAGDVGRQLRVSTYLVMQYYVAHILQYRCGPTACRQILELIGYETIALGIEVCNRVAKRGPQSIPYPRELPTQIRLKRLTIVVTDAYRRDISLHSLARIANWSTSIPV